MHVSVESGEDFRVVESHERERDDEVENRVNDHLRGFLEFLKNNEWHITNLYY